MSSQSGVAAPLVGAVVLLTLVATGVSFALPHLAGQAAGAPFVEVETQEVLPTGAPSALVVIEADPSESDSPTTPGTAPDNEDQQADAEPTEDEPVEEPATDEVDEGQEDEAEEEPVTGGLGDIPDYPVPGGFEVLDRWLDGEDLVRATVYAAVEADIDALVTYLAADRGGWTAVDLTDDEEIDPQAQWLFEHPEHPYCLWIEFYDKGRERRKQEAATGLVGPQFLVVETPWCVAEPGGYA